MFRAFQLVLCAAVWPASDGAVAAFKIGFYMGPGASREVHNGTSAMDLFYSTLTTAATATFGGSGYTVSNFTTGAAVAALKPGVYGAMVFPGGSGNGQAKAIGAAGIEAVRNHVRGGGGYIGTCGGAFLGLSHIRFYGDGPAGNGPVTQEPWDRGHGVVQIEFTAQGRSELLLEASTFGGNVSIMYWQGPIVKDKDLPTNVTRLGYFRTEIHTGHPGSTTGEMVNTPAITSIDDFGKGRVVLNSPHPELAPHLPAIYAGELHWIARLGVSKAPTKMNP